RMGVKRDGAKRSDADRRERCGELLLPEEGDDLRKCLAGRRCGKAYLGSHILRSAADRADDLGPSDFDTSIQHMRCLSFHCRRPVASLKSPHRIVLCFTAEVDPDTAAPVRL